MSNRRLFSWTEILEWLKGGGVVAITAAGLFLYFLLSVPATVFYARLGTTPDEVGITYASLLSGSTVEILVMLALLMATLITIAFILSYLSIPIRVARTRYRFRKTTHTPNVRGRVLVKRWLLTDQEFEDAIRSRRFHFEQNPDFYPALASVNPHTPKSFAEEETLMRRERKLWQLGVPTAEQSAELDLINSKLPFANSGGIGEFMESLALPGVMTLRGIRHYGQRISIVIVAIIIILLPVSAFIQAGEVINGKAYIGNNTGVFEYRADEVKIYVISPNAVQGIRALRAGKLFLLGRNDQDAVLYSPVTRSTIRIPISTIIVASTG